MKIVGILLLAAASLAAQAPAAAPAPVAVPTAAPLPAKQIVWAALAGATAGALAGTRAISFASLPPSERGAHEFRSGLVYGAIGGVLSAAVAARLTAGDTPQPHSFFWNRWNTPLLAGIVAVHVLDYTSTRYFRDRGKDEWLLTNHVVDSKPEFLATEATAAATGIGLIYLFHRTGHHKLARWVAAGYITIGVTSAVANYRYPAAGHAIF